MKKYKEDLKAQKPKSYGNRNVLNLQKKTNFKQLLYNKYSTYSK